MKKKDKLPLEAAYLFGSANGLGEEISKIKPPKFSDVREATRLRRGIIIDLFERRNLFDRFKREHWRTGTNSQIAYYLKRKNEYEEEASVH